MNRGNWPPSASVADTLKDDTRRYASGARVRANLRRSVMYVLRKHGYPPDNQEQTTRTVLEQAELLSQGWPA